MKSDWQIRFEGSGSIVPVASAISVLDGLRSGEWETTDEVRGPGDNDWRPIEDHPTFADSTSDLSPPRIEPPDETRLDMNPLIDVSLVLLIFFILTTSYSSLRRSIDMPAEPEEKTGPAKIRMSDIRDSSLEVTVWMDGEVPRIKLQDRIVDPRELEREMIAIVRESGRRQLILSVDGQVPWGVEAGVHDAAKAAEINQIYRKKYKPAQ